jgi:hypothetical protein
MKFLRARRVHGDQNVLKAVLTIADGASVEKVAFALGITVAQALRLLARMRAARMCALTPGGLWVPSLHPSWGIRV